MADRWSSPKPGWFTGTASVFPEVERKSRGLKVFLPQGKRLVARKPLTAAAPVAASFYSFPNISPMAIFKILAVECFRGPYESFIQQLHFVAAVKWEANYENPGLFVAAHFLVPRSLNSCLHAFGVPFFSSSRL
jgi:hypothetical protein